MLLLLVMKSYKYRLASLRSFWKISVCDSPILQPLRQLLHTESVKVTSRIRAEVEV